MIALLLLFVKTIFGFIDRMVVFVIKYLYQLIIAIADTDVFGNLIYQYLGRIYVFLGIFMVFKLSISMINYIINPDALTDKSKGFGKLISNVIISLILLVATPNLFNVAFDIQEEILNSNALYQIVTGKKLSNKTNENNENVMYENAKINGNSIAYGVYSAFVYPADSEDQKQIPTPYCESGTTGCVEGKCQYGSITCLLDNETLVDDKNTYWWLLSTAVGIVVAYILLVFCFDVAVRSVKLGFLQIIAPIPIMLRMDPGAKDDKFSKWLKEVGSTFASLFIRLAGLFFVIEIINLVMNPDPNLEMFSTYSDYERGGILGLFVKLFIIIGCLMFAQKLPQLISDLFGIKLDGDGFSLKKKMGNIPGLGAAKMIGAGALGFAGGAAANVWATGRNIKNMGLRKALTGHEAGSKLQFNDFTRGARTLFSDVGGGISGAYRGATSKEKNMFKAAGAGISGAAAARNLRRERTELNADGIKGWATRTGASISNLAGIESGATMFDKQISAYDSFSSVGDALDSYAEKEVLKNKNGAYSNVADLKNKVETLKSAGIDVNRADYTDSKGNFNDSAYKAAYEAAVSARSSAITAAESSYYKELSAAKEAFIDLNRGVGADGNPVDATVYTSISEMERISSQNAGYTGFDNVDLSSGKSVLDSNKSIKNTSKTVKASPEYIKAHTGVKGDKK